MFDCLLSSSSRREGNRHAVEYGGGTVQHGQRALSARSCKALRQFSSLLARLANAELATGGVGEGE